MEILPYKKILFIFLIFLCGCAPPNATIEYDIIGTNGCTKAYMRYEGQMLSYPPEGEVNLPYKQICYVTWSQAWNIGFDATNASGVGDICISIKKNGNYVLGPKCVSGAGGFISIGGTIQ